MGDVKTTSIVGAIHELPLQRGSIYHQKMIHKNLKRRIYVDTQHDSFVQCVSPSLERRQGQGEQGRQKK